MWGRVLKYDQLACPPIDRFIKPLSWLRAQEASRSLRKKSPLEPDKEITKKMIYDNMDEAVEMDKGMKDFYQNSGNFAA